MNKFLAAGPGAALIVALVAALASTTVLAQATDAQKQAASEKWKQMTPEEQAAAKAKAKAKWDAKTPEEQAAAKQKFAQKHPERAKRMEARHAASAPAATPTPAPAK